MPQLNPDPWFMMLTFSWLMFITLIPPKIYAHTLPNEPDPQGTKKSEAESWIWRWH
uniref:ATP synthase complex subunit 8 n=1 Tax=Pseudomyxus capensis TaxID=1003962 RepID=I1T2A1_PSECF|nr:ATP synthase F0 subunit 8 [Pseudomyxus capensis]AEK53123.1 ATP synthase F0 subunit 8 [Pseudomyxus capensis]